MGSNLLAPYSYIQDFSTGLYYFDTDFNIDFTVYFALDSSWFEDYPQFSQDVYTFGFRTNDVGNRDSRVKLTIAEIITAHFRKEADSILTFICDDDDGKQLLRKRKFKGWYTLLSEGSIIKLDKEVIFNHIYIYASILMHIDNSRFEEIKRAFFSGAVDVTAKFLD